MAKNKVKTNESSMNFGLIMTVYLLGIFMGALDTGIVTPARTVIQESLGVSDTAGIWMITIYTLAYAASIPVMGKLADRIGRRTIYLLSIALFGGGSLLCGLSHSMNSFAALLISRAIQAIGGGGIVPIANAEFGTTFPEEKRGMALGMVGGVYGIANIFGASAGSLVMDIFGTDRWEFIFYVNVPIAVFILIAGFVSLPNNKDKSTSKIDSFGTCLLVVMVLCIMYGLKNIDFFDFVPTVTSTSVYPFLIAFVLLLPLFIAIEKKAEDPVLDLKLFTNPRSLVTLLVAIISGIVLMGVIFVPQMCENALRVPTGTGGYFVIALGLTAGIGAMTSGKLTDKYGPKLVLGIGLVASILGALVIIFGTTVNPNKINVFGGLMLIGFAIGFTMGAPLNYMMLGEVPAKEANSALATLSLVRSLGTVVAPAIMVGFIAHAGMNMQDNLMAVMPDEINVPDLPYAEELMDMMDEQDMDMGDMPSLDEMKTVKIDMSNTEDSDIEIPDEILDEMQSADVTNINDSVKHMAEYFFDEMSPEMTEKITDGIDKGIDGIGDGISELEDGISGIKKGRDGIQKGIDGISKGIDSNVKKRVGMKASRDEMNQGINGIQDALVGMKPVYEAFTQIPEPARTPEQNELISTYETMQGQLTGMLQARDGISSGIDGISTGIKAMKKKRSNMIASRNKMSAAIPGMESALSKLKDAKWKMGELKAAVPGAFKQAKDDYMKELDKREEKIKKVYQDTLNVGFRQMFIFTGVAAAVGLLMLMLYRPRKKNA